MLACRSVLFDMDGVLVDSRVPVERTWRRFAERHGFDPARIIAVAHGRRTSDTMRELLPASDVAGEVARLDAAELEDLDGITAVRGAAALLDALPGAAWAIYTSCGRSLALRRLRAAGLAPPPVLVTSDDVTRGKPAPDGYLAAAGGLGVPAGACVVVEDAPPGIAAARAAGAAALGVTTTYPAARLAGSAAIVPDLVQVRPVVDAGALRGLTIDTEEPAR